MTSQVIELLDELFVHSAMTAEPAEAEAVKSLILGPNDLPGDWRVEWEERAAIMEYDGGLPRERAEAFALDDILSRMEHASIQCERTMGREAEGVGNV